MPTFPNARCLSAETEYRHWQAAHERAGPDAPVLYGDVLHHPVQLQRPHWSTRFCADPGRSRRTRLGLLERTADTGDAVLPAHFRAPAFGRVVRDGAAYRYEAIGGDGPGG